MPDIVLIYLNIVDQPGYQGGMHWPILIHSHIYRVTDSAKI